jgi:hypothetical protein
MIQIILMDGRKKFFNNYNDVCDYLNTIERRKSLESGKVGWKFVRRQYGSLSSLYYRTPSLKDFLTSKEKEAVGKELGLIEIVKGEWNHATQILFTPKLDLDALKRDWCHDYCHAHGLKMTEFVIKQ